MCPCLCPPSLPLFTLPLGGSSAARGGSFRLHLLRILSILSMRITGNRLQIAFARISMEDPEKLILT